MPGVRRVLRHDTALLVRIVGRRRWITYGLLLEYSSDGRLTDVDARSGQFVRDLRFAERRAEQLDLLDGVANQIRESIHRHSSLNQRVIIGTAKPCWGAQKSTNMSGLDRQGPSFRGPASFNSTPRLNRDSHFHQGAGESRWTRSSAGDAFGRRAH